MVDHLKAHRFALDAGNVCLDFANTIDEEDLPTYDALLAFAHQAGLIDDAVTGRLAELAFQRPHEARAAHASAIVLREAIFRAGTALAVGRTLDLDDLHVIERSIAEALAHGGLGTVNGGFDWTWDRVESSLERPLWPIAYAAFTLLTRGDLSRLRVCAGAACDWLFLDTTRNRSRKWCDMNTCGNRAKVARYRGREQ